MRTIPVIRSLIVSSLLTSPRHHKYPLRLAVETQGSTLGDSGSPRIFLLVFYLRIVNCVGIQAVAQFLEFEEAMGNHFSCVCSVESPVVRLADLAGNVHEFPSSRAVAELMIEFPGRVVAPAIEVLKSSRVRSLRADEEAKPGKLYVLFPMERVNSRVADDEVAAVAAVVSRRSLVKSSGAKVFPTAGAPTKVRMQAIEAPETGLAGLRLPNYRRWRPELQSINELKCIR